LSLFHTASVVALFFCLTTAPIKIEHLTVPQGSRVAVKKEMAAKKSAAAKDEAAAAEDYLAKVKEETGTDLTGLPEVVGFDHKLKRLIQELRDVQLNDTGSKALVFTQFTGTMQYIKTGLTAANIAYQTIEGHMTMTQRKKALDRFRGTSDTNVFLLSVRAGAVGLTLTAADHIFFVEPCLNPAIELQAIGRVHRIGQGK
jgi:SNF2 family DNA or RNA helicase